MSRLLTVGLVLTTLLAGCIQPPGNAADVEDRLPATGGTMTAKESKTENAALCTQGGLGLGTTGSFCAVRTISIEGTLVGFSALDVSLSTFNGDVILSDVADGKWSLVATLEARGSSAAEATARLDEIEFAWSHEGAGGHFVEAKAEHQGDTSDLEATLELKMPRALPLTIVAGTSNGNVELTGLRAAGLALASSNGDVIARAEAGQVSLTTSNGDVDADLRPLTDARWQLTTSNGEVSLKVPEGASYGYSLEGTTSNGEVTYTLSDGEKGPCPQGSQYYTPPCNHRTFESHGFARRDTQIHAVLTTSNGDVSVAAK